MIFSEVFHFQSLSLCMFTCFCRDRAQHCILHALFYTLFFPLIGFWEIFPLESFLFFVMFTFFVGHWYMTMIYFNSFLLPLSSLPPPFTSDLLPLFIFIYVCSVQCWDLIHFQFFPPLSKNKSSI